MSYKNLTQSDHLYQTNHKPMEKNRYYEKEKPINQMTLAEKRVRAKKKLRNSGRLTTDMNKLRYRDKVFKEVIDNMPTLSD